jgi:hypothetical protein
VCQPVCQAPLPEPDVADVETLVVVVPVVAGPTLGAVELVVPGELVDGVCGLPLPVEEVVVPDPSSAAAGSDAGVVVDVDVDELPLVEEVASGEPSGVPLPSVVEVGPELSVPPVVVLAGVCAAGSVMWPTGSWL